MPCPLARSRAFHYLLPELPLIPILLEKAKIILEKAFHLLVASVFLLFTLLFSAY